VRDQVGGFDGGSAMAHLIQEMHSSPAVVLGSSPPQGIGVGQAARGKQAVTPEADQHSVAFFIQYDRIVEVPAAAAHSAR
jgi:hypothetical protein